MNAADILNVLVLILAENIWPLVGVLIALLILKQVKDDIRPIFVGMVGPLAKQAQSNAISWVTGIFLATLSMLGALNEVATTMHWTYVGIACKVFGPPLATVIALIKQSPVSAPPPPPPA